MNPENYIFTHEMKVRDYECDLQGVVNNANYQHYMEHARHEFLETLGVNFGKLHEDGIDAMVAKITIEYKLPLRSGDKFVIGINLQRQGAKIVFTQDLFRLSDGKLCTKGIVETICLENGRLTRGEIFDEVFKDYL
jgi:acyl-CoA thioester hydrolase